MKAPQRLVLPADATGSGLEQGSIHFIGTATVILRCAGFTLLTDPNFLHAGDHVHLGYGVFATRRTNPAMEITELPPLDLIVLSHMHGDHFDRVAAQKLRKTLPIVSTPHAARELAKKGFRAPYALETWESVEVEKGDGRLRITSLPGRHGPPVVAKLLPPVMGSMLEFGTVEAPRAFKIYISGDTLVFDDLMEIPRRYPDIDVALLHLGGTRIFGILVTMDAKQGIEAIRIMDPRVAIPIHYNDYSVFKSPLEDFMKAVKAAGMEDRVHYLRHGEKYEFDVAEIARRRRGGEARA